MIHRVLLFLLGRKLIWRIGRSLYMFARGDIANNISTNGESFIQRQVVEIFKQTSPPEHQLIIFDVGANIGDWSEVFLNYVGAQTISKNVELHMFEPVQSTFDRLKQRLLRERVEKIYFHKIALSSSSGNDEIFINSGSGTNSFYSDSKTNTNHISIDKKTTVDFCNEHRVKEIFLLKSDTEGHDMEVIMGALPLLHQGKIKFLQFEYNHRWIFSHHFLKDVFDLLPSIPYKLGKIQPQHVEIFTEWHPEIDRFFEANYLLIHNEYINYINNITVYVDKHNTLSKIKP